MADEELKNWCCAKIEYRTITLIEITILKKGLENDI